MRVDRSFGSLVRRFLKSNVVRTGGVGVAVLVLHVLHNVFGLWYLLANVAGIGVGFVVNYVFESTLRGEWKRRSGGRNRSAESNRTRRGGRHAVARWTTQPSSAARNPSSGTDANPRSGRTTPITSATNGDGSERAWSAVANCSGTNMTLMRTSETPNIARRRWSCVR
ncbi:GtrA family protein [Halorussus sp. MSC15.2]|nr:GtrA family protein [Halorussus sp. MSC15.2]